MMPFVILALSIVLLLVLIVRLNASFLTLIPLIYTFSVVTRQPLMMLGIPLSSALSVTHGYLPPHPAPTAIANSMVPTRASRCWSAFSSWGNAKVARWTT